MEERPSYYSVIPAEVRYDKNLKDKAKLLYGEISSLTNKYGYCYASNKYFADLYGISTTTVSLLIKELVDKNYITSEIVYKENSKEILNRYLRISKEGYLRNLKEGIYENLKDNNTSNNNKDIIINNNISNTFKKPTLREVRDYCISRDSNVDAEKFIDFYESKGWYVGKNKMKDWKACIRTWEKSNKDKSKEQLPEWFNKDIEKQEISKEEQEEFDNILKSFNE